MSKYNIGFIKRIEGSEDDYTVSCNCKTKVVKTLHWRDISNKAVSCDNCENKKFVNLSYRNRVVHPYLEVLEKNNKGFKVKRTNLSVFHDEDLNVLTKQNMVQVLIYDLANKDIKLYKNGKSVNLRKHQRNFIYEDTLRRFFVEVDDVEFKDMVSADGTKELFNFTWDKLSGDRWNYHNRRIWRGLIKLLENNNTYLQILINAGFTNIGRFYGYRSGAINKKGKNPRDILGVPKFVLKYIREDESINGSDIGEIRTALGKVDGNKFREMMEIVKDEGSIRELCRALDNIIELYEKYDYNNIKKLTLYLFREIKMHQGIDSASHGSTLLKDYINMSTKMEQEFEKYPRSLKKEHDLAQMNYKVQMDEIRKKEFMRIVGEKEYKNLEYSGKEFSIITPKEMSDLIKEGDQLSHCISSYINAISEGKCRILFLRQTDRLEDPLVSIEVRNDNIRQARGYANRRVKNEEKNFIKKWAESKGLIEAYY